MRELRVVGVETDGSHVICQDPQSGEKFRIASDERLRAALAAVDAWVEQSLGQGGQIRSAPGELARAIDALLGIRL